MRARQNKSRSSGELYNARMADYRSMIAASNARIVQAERSVAEAQANYQARVAQRRAAQSEYDTIRPLVERGIEPRLSLIQLENRIQVNNSEVAAAAGVGLAGHRQAWRRRALHWRRPVRIGARKPAPSWPRHKPKPAPAAPPFPHWPTVRAARC